MILLDTSVVSELVRPRPSPHAVGWHARQVQAGLFISSITLGEIDFGARVVPDPLRRERLLAWCDRLQATQFRGRILPFDAGCARACGRLLAQARGLGRTLGWWDAQIAATAAPVGARLATRNTRHFANLGLDLLDPFALAG